MKIFVYLIVISIFLSYCKPKEVPIPENNKIYSEWVNYFDTIDFEKTFYVYGFAINEYNDIIFSAFVTENNYTIRRVGIFKIQNNEITEISQNEFSNIDKSLKEITLSSGEKILINENMVVEFDNMAIGMEPGTETYISNIVQNIYNPKESSTYKYDSCKNLWVASLHGLKKYDGQNWTSYFDSTCFYAICFDSKNNLYASTMPDMDEPGIILKYNYATWDTLVVCSDDAKWVPCMHFDKDDYLWFGVLSRWDVATESGDGLYKLNVDNDNYINYNIWNSKLPCNSVIDIAIDKYNNKWIGTYTGGLIKLSSNGEWKIFNKNNTPMYFNSVEHIVFDNEDNIWMSIQLFGLERMKE